MTAILRLEGLGVKAGPGDIRTFFQTLHIPEGGVYVVGGSHGEAFIAFATESDAQVALRRTGSFLKDSRVTLQPSSMAELEQKLEESLKKTTTSLTEREPQPHPAANKTSRSDENNVAYRPNYVKVPTVKPKSRQQDNRPKLKPKFCPGNVVRTQVMPTSRPHDHTSVSSPAAFPPDSADLPALLAQRLHPSPTNIPAANGQPMDNGTAFLLGVCTVLKNFKSIQTVVPTFEFPKDCSTTLPEEVKNPEPPSDFKPGYVRLFGLPASTTQEDICNFFKGLHVQDVLVNVELGVSRGCLVKFANLQDAADALGFNQQLLGSTCVEVRGADDKMWDRTLHEYRRAIDDCPKQKHVRSPKERPQYERKSLHSLQVKRKSDHQGTFKPLKKAKAEAKPETSLSETPEYTAMVQNLPTNITKTELKQLFGCPNVPRGNVLHLLDKTGGITDTAFLIFNKKEDFDYAINLSGCHVGSSAIKVTPITKDIMRKIIAENHPRNQRTGLTDPRLHSRLRKSDPVKTEASQPESTSKTAERHIFIRNMPANVKRSQIRSLFCKFNLSLDDIILLYDSEGEGRGEAVVTFESKQEATLAQKMHGQQFLGTKILLTCINGKQREEILVKH